MLTMEFYWVTSFAESLQLPASELSNDIVFLPNTFGFGLAEDAVEVSYRPRVELAWEIVTDAP